MINCDNCLFGHICRDESPCEDYSPIYKEQEDEILADQIESDRTDYYNAYIEYIAEYSDFNFELSC